MNLTELPRLIKSQALEVQRISEQLEQSRYHKKLADIEIEKQVQALDKKVCSNENQRDIARYDLRDNAYNALLAAIVREESQLAAAKIELEYLKNNESVCQLGIVFGVCTLNVPLVIFSYGFLQVARFNNAVKGR